MKTVIDDYIRKEMFPNMWCPGCGNGIVLGAIIRAIDELKWDKDEIVAVSGIGCSSRITGYVDFYYEYYSWKGTTFCYWHKNGQS